MLKGEFWFCSIFWGKIIGKSPVLISVVKKLLYFICQYLVLINAKILELPKNDQRFIKESKDNSFDCIGYAGYKMTL